MKILRTPESYRDLGSKLRGPYITGYLGTYVLLTRPETLDPVWYPDPGSIVSDWDNL